MVDSASIEVSRRGRRAKTDRLDATKLVLMLVRWHAGDPKVWSVVRVRSDADEDARQFHRELDELPTGLSPAVARAVPTTTQRVYELLATLRMTTKVTHASASPWSVSAWWAGSQSVRTRFTRFGRGSADREQKASEMARITGNFQV